MTVLRSVVMRLGSMLALACAVACSSEAADHVLQAPPKKPTVAAAGAGGADDEPTVAAAGAGGADDEPTNAGAPTRADAGNGGEPMANGGAAGGEPSAAGQGGQNDAGNGGEPNAGAPMAGTGGASIGGSAGAPMGGAPAGGMTSAGTGGTPDAGAGGEGGAPIVDPFGCTEPDNATAWAFVTVQPGECLTAGAYSWRNTPGNFYVWRETNPTDGQCDAALGGWLSVRPGADGSPITVAVAIDNNWPSADFGAAVRKNIEGNVQAGLPNCSNLPVGVGY